MGKQIHFTITIHNAVVFQVHVCERQQQQGQLCTYSRYCSNNVFSHLKPIDLHLQPSRHTKRGLNLENTTYYRITLTLILGSVRDVHMAMSSLVLMSGYLFLANKASNSCNCCEVKWVLCLLWRLSLTLFLPFFDLAFFSSSN